MTMTIKELITQHLTPYLTALDGVSEHTKREIVEVLAFVLECRVQTELRQALTQKPMVLQIPSAPLPGSREPVPAVVAALSQALERAESGETVAYALVELFDTGCFGGLAFTSTSKETTAVLGGLAVVQNALLAQFSHGPPTPQRSQDA